MKTDFQELVSSHVHFIFDQTVPRDICMLPCLSSRHLSNTHSTGMICMTRLCLLAVYFHNGCPGPKNIGTISSWNWIFVWILMCFLDFSFWVWVCRLCKIKETELLLAPTVSNERHPIWVKTVYTFLCASSFVLVKFERWCYFFLSFIQQLILPDSSIKQMIWKFWGFF